MTSEPVRDAEDVALPTPFRFSVGAPFDRGNFISLGGQVTWGDCGWLVSDGNLDYQAPIDQSQTQAVVEWLRRFFGTQSDRDGRS